MLEAQYQKSLNNLHEEKEIEKKQVTKKLVRDHSREIHELEDRLERVLNNALDVKEDEIETLRN